MFTELRLIPFLAAFVPVIITALVFYFFYKRKNNSLTLLWLFVLGMFSVIIVRLFRMLFMYFYGLFFLITLALIEVLNRFVLPGNLYLDEYFSDSFLQAFGAVAFPEEITKALMLLIGLYISLKLGKWYTRILYGMILGLGFAYMKAIFEYFSAFPHDVNVLKVSLLFPVHIFVGGIMGFLIDKKSDFIVAVFISFLLHGILSFIILYWSNNNYILAFLFVSISLVLIWIIILIIKNK